MSRCHFFFILILILPALGLASSNICEHVDPRNSILTPLTEVSLGKWCTTSICYKNNEKTNRKKCIYQIVNYFEDKPKIENGKEYNELRKDPKLVENSFKISIEEISPDSGGLEWMEHSFSLETGSQCYDQCQSEHTKKLFSKKTTESIYQEDCRQCLLKLPAQNSYKRMNSFKKLLKGQKCYHYCEKDVVSGNCKSCMKTRVNPVYILTADNRCNEVFESEERKAYETSMSLCDSAEPLYKTFYYKQGKYNLDVLVFGNEPKCIEQDNFKTLHFRRQVPMSYCEAKDAVNNSERDTMNKDTPAISPRGSSSAHGIKQ